MARVKKCPECGLDNPPGEFFCDCGYALIENNITDSAEIGTQCKEISKNSSGTFKEAVANTLYVAKLEFPWGIETVDQQLSVGRDAAFSPLADHLSLCPYVSRKHAELILEDSHLIVHHLSKTNPTYINDRPMSFGEITELVDRDVISFSRYVHAVVRLAKK